MVAYHLIFGPSTLELLVLVLLPVLASAMGYLEGFSK